MRWNDHGPLAWSRPSLFRREFELRSGETLVATLRIRGAFRAVGLVESADGAWAFARTGFLQRRATIRESGKDVAAFSSTSWSGHAGEIAFASGRRFELAVNLWATRVEVRSEVRGPLVVVHRRGWYGRNADVEIAPGPTLPELPVLVTYAWFHLVTLEEDAAAAVVTG